MTKIKELLAALALTLGISVVIAPPANGGYFNDVTKAANDAGWSRPLHIVCTDGRQYHLYDGQSSPARCGAHVERIVVGSGYWVLCKNYLPPYQNIGYYPGAYNHVPSGSSLKCYTRAPL